MPLSVNTFQEHFSPGQDPTCRCTAAVVGKRFVSPSANPPGGLIGTENIRIAQSGANPGAVLGVAGCDGVLNEEIPVRRGKLIGPVTVGAAVVTGNLLTSDASGRAVPVAAGQFPVAIAVEDQATVGNDCAVALL